MPDIRNQKSPIIQNDIDFYKELRKNRNVKNLSHYATPIFRHPTVDERSRINAAGYVWGYGDRFYKLAHQYYGDVRYWWVIAWYNLRPLETDFAPGDTVIIPTPLETVLSGFGIV